MDGTLINLDYVPSEREVAFVDRHGNHSINALCVADTDLMFRYYHFFILVP